MLLTCLGMPQMYSIAILIALAFIPVIYSYIYYKQIDAGAP